MTKVGATQRGNNLGIYGRVGKGYKFGQRVYAKQRYGVEEHYNEGSEYGVREYGDFLYGEVGNMWGIYQRRHNKGKVIYSKLKFYRPNNPKTVPQQNWRAVFTGGMLAWKNLTNEQKAEYNERAKKISLHGVNLFMREYLKSN